MEVCKALEILQEIDDDGVGLTDWEVDFLDSMLKQLELDRPPTPKQEVQINKIYDSRIK